MKKLSHTDSDGKVKMIDIRNKSKTERTASAFIRVNLSPQTYQMIKENQIAKGNVLTVAKIADIQAAKKTSEMIPLCHQILLNKIEIKFTLNDEKHFIEIVSVVITNARTGVEMEALTACSIAALTIYDMVKAVQKDIEITDLRLLSKKGGKSGEFINNNK